MKEIVNKYWSKSANGYSKHVRWSMRSTRERKAWQQIFTEALGRGNLTVLDVGTGPGIVAFLLAELGHDVTGVDFSEEMLRNARENAARFGLSVKFTPGDTENLPFEDESFDAVVNRAVLWTLPNPEKAIMEWWRVLKPGGRLVIIDGNWADHKKMWHRQIWKLFLAWPLILITEQWNPWRSHSDDIDEGLPLIDAKRPETDIELVKGAGFTEIEVISKLKRITLISHLKYGYQGDHFLISGTKGNGI